MLFLAKGHDAWSCDLIGPKSNPEIFFGQRNIEKHLEMDIFEVINSQFWDLMICHPPCTDLAVSGALHFKNKILEQEEAVAFCRRLLTCKIPKIALENPIGVLSSKLGSPDQIIDPTMFGYSVNKATCLWLKGLNKLKGSPKKKGISYIHLMGPSETRQYDRSETLIGIAQAMAEQWGSQSSLLDDLINLI